MADAPNLPDQHIDRIDSLLETFRVPLGLIAVLWFAATCASYAGFVRLPEFRLLTGVPALIGMVAYNALYLGFVWPRVDRRRRERAAKGTANG